MFALLLDTYYRLDRWGLWRWVGFVVATGLIRRMTGRFGYTQDWILWVSLLQFHRNAADHQGFVGLIALTILTLSSFRIVRQMAYEAFLFTHIVTTV